DHSQLRHFMFPKQLLFHKGMLTNHPSKPKIPFPLYPTSHKHLNPLPHNTQHSQKQYFIHISQTIHLPTIKPPYFNQHSL
uniref:MepB family protein n=1 Tax=Staphylococcus epidermidis TaxID=1282 RepID=UPI0016424951